MAPSPNTSISPSSSSASVAPRRALLILGLQNEFLDPATGRCLVLLPPDGQPAFVALIQAFLPKFRQHGGGDVIWIRSEHKAQRDFTDPRSDEVILIVSSDDDSSDDDAGEKIKGRLKKGADGKWQSRPPLLTDAFLSIGTAHPPCAAGSTAAEWHSSVAPYISSPPDKVLTKTWYSAFKETTLLQTLRGRFVTELYICGLMTNVCALATAADAAKHGFEVGVLSDCLGYRNRETHEKAMSVMVEDFAVEDVNSTLLVKTWEKKESGDKSAGPMENHSAMNAGASGMLKEDLAKMVEGLKLGPQKSKSKAKDESARKAQGVDVPRLPPSEDASTKSPATQTTENKLSDKPSQVGESEKEQSAGPLRVQKRIGRRRFDSIAPILGQGDSLGEGDSQIVNDILPKDLAETAFEDLKKEVAWRSMFHRGGEVPRLVAVEGDIDEDGSFPIYRHPADQSPPLLPFSRTVSLIREHVQKVLQHPVNHVLIQYYRDGNDYISEHSDKSLDIVRGSKIVNVSLGAQRVMTLRTKKDYGNSSTPHDLSLDIKNTLTEGKKPPETEAVKRTTQRIPLPHNSMFVLGQESNKKWLHAIKQDKRQQFLKKPEELAFNGERISLTFRHIGTFLSHDEQTIFGQGAVSKSKEEPGKVINGETPETERMIRAFGMENHQSDFDWDANYGSGFDVLHFKEQEPTLFSIDDDPACIRVKLCMNEKGIKYSEERLNTKEKDSKETKSPSFLAINPRGEAPVLLDTDREKTTVYESLAIMQYLEMFYPSEEGQWLLPSIAEERAAYARALNRLHESDRLLGLYPAGEMAEIEKEFGIWEGYLEKSGGYVAGEEVTLADIALWPVVHAFRIKGVVEVGKWKNLEEWCERIGERESVRALLLAR